MRYLPTAPVTTADPEHFNADRDYLKSDRDYLKSDQDYLKSDLSNFNAEPVSGQDYSPKLPAK